MNSKRFYDAHSNFSSRSLLEYEISPGIRCKFDIILDNMNICRNYTHGLDLGCSGNSFLNNVDNLKYKSFLDISELPLTQYTPRSRISKNNNNSFNFVNPICGDIRYLPYLSEKFDIVCSLDTLEHIKNDETAIAEISRVLKEDGICVITVPHRMDYYTIQDQLIGHYRRYEMDHLIELFRKYHLKSIRCFNVYGKLMKIVFLQTLNPKKTEQKLISLRHKYQSNLFFKILWKIIVRILSNLMKIDAKYHKLHSGMNLGFIFIKK